MGNPPQVSASQSCFFQRMLSLCPVEGELELHRCQKGFFFSFFNDSCFYFIDFLSFY